MAQAQRTFETEVAVLQTEFKNLDGKFEEIKSDVKALSQKLDHYTETTHSLLKELQTENEKQHNELADKVTKLERWQWMLMGAGMALGVLGYSGIEKFLLH